MKALNYAPFYCELTGHLILMHYCVDVDRTIAQHHERWEEFMYEWLKWTAVNGLFRELGAAYWPRTWETVFNMYDLALSTRVRARAKMFIDIALVESQQASINGVRGGEKSRAKRDGFGVWTQKSIGSAEGLEHTMLYQVRTHGSAPSSAHPLPRSDASLWTMSPTRNIIDVCSSCR
eukprot:COSAG06_NODE_19461_length_837_cov_1.352304_1_plen_176_part_10